MRTTEATGGSRIRFDVMTIAITTTTAIRAAGGTTAGNLADQTTGIGEMLPSVTTTTRDETIRVLTMIATDLTQAIARQVFTSMRETAHRMNAGAGVWTNGPGAD